MTDEFESLLSDSGASKILDDAKGQSAGVGQFLKGLVENSSGNLPASINPHANPFDESVGKK